MQNNESLVFFSFFFFSFFKLNVNDQNKINDYPTHINKKNSGIQ